MTFNTGIGFILVKQIPNLKQLWHSLIVSSEPELCSGIFGNP